jgi:hypothetical protein
VPQAVRQNFLVRKRLQAAAATAGGCFVAGLIAGAGAVGLGLIIGVLAILIGGFWNARLQQSKGVIAGIGYSLLFWILVAPPSTFIGLEIGTALVSG